MVPTATESRIQVCSNCATSYPPGDAEAVRSDPHHHGPQKKLSLTRNLSYYRAYKFNLSFASGQTHRTSFTQGKGMRRSIPFLSQGGPLEGAMHLAAVSVPVLRISSPRNFRLSERHYPPNTESPLHTHRKTYMIITLEGQYSSTFGTRIEKFRRWTVSYHGADAPHSSRYPEQGARVLYVEIPPEHLQAFSLGTASHLTTFSLEGGLAETTARQIYREFSHPDDLSPVVIDSLVMHLFAQLCRRRSELPQSLPRWLGRANELIRSQFKEPLGLATLAEAVHVHPVHLAREYRRSYGSTVGEQIRRLRIEYACQLLKDTGDSLSTVALAAGFSDQSHFATCFRKHTGMVPSAFRRTAKENVASPLIC